MLSGVIPVFKPPGITSKDVSRVLQKRFGKLKIGHVGTLDPDADGVLPVLIGAATKLQDYLLEMPKTYRFSVKLGSATTTLDASGAVTETASFDHISKQSLVEAAKIFEGSISQIPPLFSAVKLNGKELYKHARSGASELSVDDAKKLTRTVTVYSLRLLDFKEDYFEMEMVCSKGTYVRTIADDLCRLLETRGHVVLLRREVSAGFELEKCTPLEQLIADNVALDRFLIPANQISIGLPIWQLNDRILLRRIRDGQRVQMPIQEFSRNLISQNGGQCFDTMVFLIRDEHGLNVGIGELVLDVGVSQVMIHLKRGL